MNKKTLIIGAGPAGLAAAMELAKTGNDFLLVEKQNQVGGLAKTYLFKEGDLVFRTDNGPHRFYSKNKALYEFLESLLQEQWLEVRRQTRQFIGGKFYNYPVSPAQALANIGFKKAIKFATDYGMAKIKYDLFKKPVRNFEDYIISNFGRGLGEFNMINYTEKIWGVPASTIHLDWAEQRIRGLSVSFLIKAALAKAASVFKTEQPRTLIDYFYYPEYGTGLIYETIAQRLIKKNYKILTASFPLKIFHKNQLFHGAIIKTSKKEIKVSLDFLVESMPMEEFLAVLEPAPPREILDLGAKLQYRHQVYLFITLNKNRVTNDQWIYFPEKDIPFGRISEMKNFSSKMSPVGKTSLLIEFFCSAGDDIWQQSKEEIFELTMAHLEKLGFCHKSEVRNSYLFKQAKVYPIYDVHYKDYLEGIKQYLDQFKNLFYIGRPGRFRYTNQDHSLEMGLAAAQTIVGSWQGNIDQIGLDPDYFENSVLKK